MAKHAPNETLDKTFRPATPGDVMPLPAGAVAPRQNFDRYPWVELIGGKTFAFVGDEPFPLTIEELARTLARLVRYNGATTEPYSVAQHSVHVADIVRRRGGSILAQRFALLHDAHEAVLGDLVTPVKMALGGDFRAQWAMLTDAIDARIYAAYGLEPGPSDQVRNLVREADAIALATEKRDLMPSGLNWGWLPEPDTTPARPITADKAAAWFVGIWHGLASANRLPDGWELTGITLDREGNAISASIRIGSGGADADRA